jgi:hypothetical protein
MMYVQYVTDEWGMRMDLKQALVHLIKAGRDALHLDQTLNSIGYKDTPYFNLHGEIADAVYKIIGEETDTFDESMTYAAMHDIYTSDEICAERLAEMASNPTLNIPETTLAIIQESASNRGISLLSMINLILSEWAIKEAMIQSVLNT